MGNPAAYFLTWTTYGAWLHGDARGSVDDWNNTPRTSPLSPQPSRAQRAVGRMSDAPLALDHGMRGLVEDAIRRHCVFREWPLVALNVRSNHVHCVVGWKGIPPERVMTELKTWATRALKSLPTLDHRGKFWTVHGSTRYLWDDRSVHDASRYVLFGQDRA